jgi:hypothetical protein
MAFNHINGKRRKLIDIEQAVKLFARHGDWDAVANMMRSPDRPLKGSSIYMAVWRAGLLTQEGRRARLPGSQRELNDRQLGAIWRPVEPRPLTVIPCYRTNTVHR